MSQVVGLWEALALSRLTEGLQLFFGSFVLRSRGRTKEINYGLRQSVEFHKSVAIFAKYIEIAPHCLAFV